MHYLMWSDSVDEVSFWDDYVQVNQIFANQVIANYQEGDISKLIRRARVCVPIDTNKLAISSLGT